MGKRITALFIGALCLAGGLAAQTPQPILKGKVIDRGGETVIGAHVKWKNAQGGAVTDLEIIFLHKHTIHLEFQSFVLHLSNIFFG